jgi:hypothetical protein
MSGCEHLGAVEGSQSIGVIALGAGGGAGGQRETMDALRNQTALLGGTHVVVTSAHVSDVGRGAAYTQGEAYKCPIEYRPGQTSKTGCGNDMDCKGDRVCVRGDCVLP